MDVDSNDNIILLVSDDSNDGGDYGDVLHNSLYLTSSLSCLDLDFWMSRQIPMGMPISSHPSEMKLNKPTHEIYRLIQYTVWFIYLVGKNY